VFTLSLSRPSIRALKASLLNVSEPWAMKLSRVPLTVPAALGRRIPTGSCLRPILASVVQAREARYLMLNAPESALEEICSLVPGSGAPSVIPLAQAGMVAVHALVPAADVWRLLPRLEAAGASSILLVPVERMLA